MKKCMVLIGLLCSFMPLVADEREAAIAARLDERNSAIAAREDAIYATLVDLYNNKRITQKNVNILSQKYKCSDFSGILRRRKQELQAKIDNIAFKRNCSCAFVYACAVFDYKNRIRQGRGNSVTPLFGGVWASVAIGCVAKVYQSPLQAGIKLIDDISTQLNLLQFEE